ncbi:hypothetical protein BDV25DRAFT_40931 [Aspergillus avenaceus]|uniref:Transmembrane protein n=1 Tax=Aspergillus avenaceus TaxID=36643 RepID=A0A5N6TLC3_ASPAV|nr:hypothetical protein BDV25DRAFT_40931 [Aspergillus avenaceus]
MISRHVELPIQSVDLPPPSFYSPPFTQPFFPYLLLSIYPQPQRSSQNMVHKSKKSVTRASTSRSIIAATSSSSIDPEMDRKVYIPLCFCLISFAVMVYVN